MVNAGDKYTAVNWPGCSTVEVLRVCDADGAPMVYHSRITETGFPHDWHSRLDVFESDIESGELVLIAGETK